MTMWFGFPWFCRLSSPRDIETEPFREGIRHNYKNVINETRPT